MVSPENIHTGSIIQTKQVIFRNAYIYTHVYAITMKKEAMNEGKWEGVHERVWREKRDGKKVIIL